VLITAPRRGRSALLAGLAVITFAAGCTEATDGPEPPGGERSRPTGGSARPSVFYVDPASPAAEQVAAWQAEGRTAEADLLRRISDQPTARWLTGDVGSVRDETATLAGQAAQAGQTPVLVAHNAPELDCGRHGSQGAVDAAAYRTWIREFAGGIGERPAIVILEPNAIADAVDGCVKDVRGRYELLADAIAVLRGAGSVRVYLDAGHPHWIKDVPKLVTALRRAGIATAHGFALNVASFDSTVENIGYGRRISDALGGDVRFVIDTSRNGNGPYPGDPAGAGPSWCNPPGRALGEPPTDAPGPEGVDALLWIKYPGESDGACRPGEPESGDWWPEYAVGLARAAGEPR
jgi:endoglucanase